MSREGRFGDGQYRFRGMERDRLWSRLPNRTGDPMESPYGCRHCDGTGLNLTVDPPCPCGSCLGTGWSS